MYLEAPFRDYEFPHKQVLVGLELGLAVYSRGLIGTIVASKM